MQITKKEFQKIVKESVSKSEVCRKMGIAGNGTGLRKVTQLSEQYNVDISHFSLKAAMNKFNRRYELVVKTCPVCGKEFQTNKNHKREKVTCSHSCSNTFFAHKRNLPERYTNYKTICFSKWPKKCLLCGYEKIVSVHHLDENHNNNNIENLIPLCMNCHGEVHSKEYREEALNKLNEVLRSVA